MKNFIPEREKMVAIIKSRGITDAAILNAMLKVPRHLFVSKDLRECAYDDTALPISHCQTISQPYIVAYMMQEVNLTNKSRVLEIGTGSGYQTALLAEICREVFTIEIVEELAVTALKLLQKLGYKNIRSKIDDGREGWINTTAFDAIIVTAKTEKLPPALISQLAVSGKMIIPIQKSPDKQVLIKISKESEDNDYTSEELLNVRFVPLVSPSEIH
jgi:protein-L-isoaspartate(D-aspartate) O-methyltransferase